MNTCTHRPDRHASTIRHSWRHVSTLDRLGHATTHVAYSPYVWREAWMAVRAAGRRVFFVFLDVHIDARINYSSWDLFVSLRVDACRCVSLLVDAQEKWGRAVLRLFHKRRKSMRDAYAGRYMSMRAHTHALTVCVCVHVDVHNVSICRRVVGRA